MIRDFSVLLFLAGDCDKTQFKCNGTDLCLSELLWCDGNQDCPDGSDEPENCVICAYYITVKIG